MFIRIATLFRCLHSAPRRHCPGQDRPDGLGHRSDVGDRHPAEEHGALLPTKIGDATVEYIQLDDGGDTTRAVQNAKKLIRENNVDALIGPSTTPNALAILDMIAEGKVPLLATVGTSSVVEPIDAKKRWVFKTTQNDDLDRRRAASKHMVKNGVKTIGFIGFNDPYGENWYKVFGGDRRESRHPHRRERALRAHRPERHRAGAEADRGEARRGADRGASAARRCCRRRRSTIWATRDAIYQTHAVATDDFIRLGKEKVEGTILAAGSMLVIDDVADSDPIKKVALAYIGAYEKQFGQRPATFGANTYDAGLLLQRAIPVALEGREAGHRSVPRRAARRARAGAGRRRLPGRLQHESDQSQRHGRARARAGRSSRTASSGCWPSEPRYRAPMRRGAESSASCSPRAARSLRRRQAAARRCPDGSAGRRRRAGASAAARSTRSSPSCVPAMIALARALRARCARHRLSATPPMAWARASPGAFAPRRSQPGWVVALADMPWIRTETIAAVADALARGAMIAAPDYAGVRGHPVGFAATLLRRAGRAFAATRARSSCWRSAACAHAPRRRRPGHRCATSTRRRTSSG